MASKKTPAKEAEEKKTKKTTAKTATKAKKETTKKAEKEEKAAAKAAKTAEAKVTKAEAAAAEKAAEAEAAAAEKAAEVEAAAAEEPAKAEPAVAEEPAKAEPAPAEEPAKAEPTVAEEPAKAEPAVAEEPAKAETAPAEEPAKAEPTAVTDGKNPLALIIMDGFGYRKETAGNAIAEAKTPTVDRLWKECPNTQIGASGMDVGLPDGQMGNSEVGHTNIGAGRIVYQELTRITKSIQDGDFFENEAFMNAVTNCQWHDSTLHIFGLMSDGGVHSHLDHICALLDLAKRNGLWKVCVHCFMDGRDTPPTSGITYVQRIKDKIDEIGIGCIATVSGRYYAMDRDKRWERLEVAYNAMVNGVGKHCGDAIEAIQASYDEGVTDEFIVPVIITEGAEIQPSDSIIFANFRPDRAREITRAIIDPDFDGFHRQKGALEVDYICMTQYDATMPKVLVAFKPESLSNTFGEYIAEQGLTQLRIAETEKYAHVTFFFNGGVETEYKNEERSLIKSPTVATYDLKPEMSAYEVTDEVVKRIDSGRYDVIILNYANCDMVGHTGVYSAAVKAVEAVDTCLGRVLEALQRHGGCALVTADHGNADQMLDDDGTTPFTAHSTNPVPLFLVGRSDVKALKPGGVLADLAPTMLELLGLEQPAEMTGHSLLEK